MNTPHQNLEQTACHQAIDQRSLAMDRIIAERIQAKPELLQKAKETLARWITLSDPEAKMLAEARLLAL